MDPVTLRVAARYYQAGFIPDKFFRTKKSELKTLLSKPLSANEPATVRWTIQDQLIPFFDRFEKDLQDLGLHQAAEQSIKDRVGTAKHIVGKIAESYDRFAEATEAVVFPPRGIEDEVAWTIERSIRSVFEKNVSNLGTSLKAIWKADPNQIRSLALKILKKATPDEWAAIEASRNGDYNAGSRKWSYFARIRLDDLAKRLITKEKMTWDPLGWLDFTHEVLRQNYSEETLDTFTEFDLYGMKVVVDDATVTPDDIKVYVKYLDKAYHLLRSKKLGKAWYGIIFIRCESCGGVNQHGANLGVGGHYHIGPNTITIYSRPSSFIVELVAHELGHRYWFKHMTQSQRARFESLVRVHKSPRPKNIQSRPILSENVAKAKSEVDASVRKVRVPLTQLKAAGPKFRLWKDALKKFYEPVSKAGWEFQNDIVSAVHSTGADSQINTDVKQLFQDVLDSSEAARKFLWEMDLELEKQVNATPEPAGPIESLNKFWAQAFRRVLSSWLEEANQKLEMAVTTAYIYIDAAVQAYNEKENSKADRLEKEWQESWDKDERPVTPVSNYGKSNIDEAFAEVFAHYVLEFDMNRDQLESFRTVLSFEKGLLNRIMRRFLAEVLLMEPLPRGEPCGDYSYYSRFP